MLSTLSQIARNPETIAFVVVRSRSASPKFAYFVRSGQTGPSTSSLERRALFSSARSNLVYFSTLQRNKNLAALHLART
ncbi:MAG: hypothetical protein AAFR75_05365, partial [Pseudomonadota bacterium]